MTFGFYSDAAALAAAYRPRDAALADAIAFFRRIRMPGDTRFALVRYPHNPLCKPVTYASAQDLARAVHRHRGDAAIQLRDQQPLNIKGWGEVHGVSIYTVVDGAERDWIGWAWLDGGGREALERALKATCSTAPTIGRAA